MSQRSAANPRSSVVCLRVRGCGASETLASLRSSVESANACTLPGCSIKFDSFLPVLRRAQSRGYVKDHEAEYVATGLMQGFTLGVDIKAMQKLGKRAFRNYPSSLAAHASVTKAVQRRVERGKTVNLGKAREALVDLHAAHDAFVVFPMGAVPKPNQSPDLPASEVEYRPTDDHTRTRLNAHTIMGILGHSLNTYKEVEWLLKTGYFLRVSDVEDAFLLIPLHPDLWLFMLFRWACDGEGADEDLLAHLFADFGTKGAPGTFQLLMVRVVVQMARSEMILTLDLVVYVDDAGIIGDDRVKCDDEMLRLQDWSWQTCGVPWKRPKDKAAAIPQYYIGFWWNSLTHTRSLDESKLAKYLFELSEAGQSASLTLRERQSLAGKVQRAIMTMPPGAACLLVNCYLMMSRLTLPWHARRTSKAERDDYKFVHDVLRYNVGSGYYTYSGFSDGPTVLSDASKSRAYTGGGYLESSGFYDFWSYGASASRKPIDYLEGDVVVEACKSRGSTWRGCIVPFGIDNKVIQCSAAKGRSAAPRLNTLMKELFVYQIRDGYVLATFWISTTDNYLSDHLSRDREAEFLFALPDSKFLSVPFSELKRHPEAGRRRHLSSDDDPGMAALRQLLQSYSSNSLFDGPSRGVGVGGDAQLLSISYDFCTIYDGLPPELFSTVDRIMDNRLAVSSRAKVLTGFNNWRTFVEQRGWEPLVETGDKRRGGRMIAWVCDMIENSDLVYSSISTYVWGMRTWQVLQHQADPCFGVMHWREFMGGVAVLTAVPGEPRKQFPLSDFEAIMESLDSSDFVHAQFGLVLLVLLFTFSRTECPCPKTWTGRDCFDPKRHWQVGDFKLVRVLDQWVLYVRFKAIKQDKRLERPSASGPLDLPFTDDSTGLGHDWVPIGDVPGVDKFSIAFWYMAFVRAVGRYREPHEPMFLSRDQDRAYTYSCLRADLRARQVHCELSTVYTPHCIRVLGYNLSKAGNGEDLTVAHGGWMSSAHDRYERFTQAQQLSIPAHMLQRASVFAGADAAGRSISRVASTRHAFAVPDEPDAESAGAEADEDEPTPHLDLLPPGFTESSRSTPAGRVYPVYHAPGGGRAFRSRAEAWRAHAASLAAAESRTDDDDLQAYVPMEENVPSLFDFASPTAAGPVVSTGRHSERLSDKVRRLRRQLSEDAAVASDEPEPAAEPAAVPLPFNAFYDFVEVSSQQCGNPLCTVPSANGKHSGNCLFPPPLPRRR
jgi:hypothetical protein